MENSTTPFCAFMAMSCAGLDCAWFDSDNCHCAFQSIASNRQEPTENPINE
jgi:hypothetical protein